jgi:hypothetical protein
MIIFKQAFNRCSLLKGSISPTTFFDDRILERFISIMNQRKTGVKIFLSTFDVLAILLTGGLFAKAKKLLISFFLLKSHLFDSIC